MQALKKEHSSLRRVKASRRGPSSGCALNMLMSQGNTKRRKGRIKHANIDNRSPPKQNSGEASDDKNELLNCTTLLQPRLPLAEWKNGPLTIINYVRRTLQPVVLNCASDDAQFGTDEYIVAKKAKSVVCMPILLKNVLKVPTYLPIFSFIPPHHPYLVVFA